jgi:hypothetical protein
MKVTRAIETRYKGRLMRSRHEARWAVFFDSTGIEWIHEPEGFNLPGYDYDKGAAFDSYMQRFSSVDTLSPEQNEQLARKMVEQCAEMASHSIYYLPDFWLPEVEAFAEVKPPVNAERENRNFLLEYEKMMRLTNCTGYKVLFCSDFANPIKGMKPGGQSVDYPYPHVEFIDLFIDPKVFDVARSNALSAQFEYGKTPSVNTLPNPTADLMGIPLFRTRPNSKGY